MKTDYTPILKGIQSHGFRVEASAGNITATNSTTGEIEFNGGIDAAQDWLDWLDDWGKYSPPQKVKDTGKKPFTICVVLLTILIALCLFAPPVEWLGFLIGAVGLGAARYFLKFHKENGWPKTKTVLSLHPQTKNRKTKTKKKDEN